MVSLLVSEVGRSLDYVIVLGSRGLWLVWLVMCFSYFLIHCFLNGLMIGLDFRFWLDLEF